MIRMPIWIWLIIPVIIHDRDAHYEVYKMLKKIGEGQRKGVIHCFSRDMEMDKAFMKRGYYNLS